jgi:hypothetical protein
MINNNDLEKYIKKMPYCIEKVILSFLIPQNVTFIDHNIVKYKYIYSDSEQRSYIFSLGKGNNYNQKYKIVIYNNSKIYKSDPLTNVYDFTNYFLSVIPKKKKNRYYITKEKIIQVCMKCGTNSCHMSCYRGNYYEMLHYSSKYVGTNLNYALVELLFNYP